MMVDLYGYEGKYTINESGIVVNKTGHVMRSAVSNSGYLRVALEDKDGSGHRTNESIHRLVAKTFIPNPDDLPCVLHRDNDPFNNHVSNLKWGTQSENIQQAFEDGRKESPMKDRSFVYEVYTEDESDVVQCAGRKAVSDLIGYELISLKNMVGNGRKIALGPYKDYMIRRLDKTIEPAIVYLDDTFND